MRALVFAGLVAACALSASIERSHAQDAPAPAPIAKPLHHKRVASLKHATPKAKPDAPVPAMAPWAAVDPTRAGAAAPPETAAVPGVQHVVRPDEDRMSVGMKWTSSNDTTGRYSTQGVVNEVNHDLGAANAAGTDAEMGLKLHF